MRFWIGFKFRTLKMSDMYLKMLLKKRMLIVHSNTKYIGMSLCASVKKPSGLKFCAKRCFTNAKNRHM